MLDAFMIWPGMYVLGWVLAGAAGATAAAMQAQVDGGPHSPADVAMMWAGFVIVPVAFVVSVVALASWPVTAVVWCFWTVRIVQNHNALHPNDPPIGVFAAIGGWLVPVVNLVVPFGLMRRLWRRAADEHGWGDWVLTFWWLCWVVVWLWGASGPLTDSWTEEELALGSLAIRPFRFGLAVLAYFVVEHLTRRQEAHAAGASG